MQYVNWLLSLPRGVLAGAAAVVVLLVIWSWARIGRRHYLVVKKSDATQLVTYELGRIADALERLSSLPPPHEVAPSAEVNSTKRVDLSMFGREI
ncbi:MAG TPA: hypothetical protein VJO53_09200 [Candidatus Acidoferrales bacterium]|nr:hypothetical protein [Candidatus Acidoferrales bacterium]